MNDILIGSSTCNSDNVDKWHIRMARSCNAAAHSRRIMFQLWITVNHMFLFFGTNWASPSQVDDTKLWLQSKRCISKHNQVGCWFCLASYVLKVIVLKSGLKESFQQPAESVCLYAVAFPLFFHSWSNNINGLQSLWLQHVTVHSWCKHECLASLFCINSPYVQQFVCLQQPSCFLFFFILKTSCVSYLLDDVPAVPAKKLHACNIYQSSSQDFFIVIPWQKIDFSPNNLQRQTGRTRASLWFVFMYFMTLSASFLGKAGCT